MGLVKPPVAVAQRRRDAVAHGLSGMIACGDWRQAQRGNGAMPGAALSGRLRRVVFMTMASKL
jgi:hypothetical protein